MIAPLVVCVVSIGRSKTVAPWVFLDRTARRASGVPELGVTVTVLLAAPVPFPFVAVTEHEDCFPFARPVTAIGDPVRVTLAAPVQVTV